MLVLLTESYPHLDYAKVTGLSTGEVRRLFSLDGVTNPCDPCRAELESRAQAYRYMTADQSPVRSDAW